MWSSANAELSTRMPVEQALQVLCELRRPDEVVVTNQGSARLWPRMSQHPGDFNYKPSTMGGAIPLALGFALACPVRPVTVLSGDGSLLMNFGSLVSVVASAARNLTIILLDNGLYEVTGGQATAAAQTAIRWPDVARGLGFESVAEFSDSAGWRAAAGEFLISPGPRFVCLQVAPLAVSCLLDPSPPVAEQLQRLRGFLQSLS